MLTGPAPASRKALAKAGLTVDDIDLFEINEAFAAVALRFMKDLGVSHEKVNVNGGAIAMGHPLGATGAMILGTLIDELERRELRYGLATLCVGGGMGIATIVERAGDDRAEGRPLGAGRRRHRRGHPRRPGPQRQHHERRATPRRWASASTRWSPTGTSITGVIITSAKKTFFAGGDLDSLSTAGPDDAPAVMAHVDGGQGASSAGWRRWAGRWSRR